MSRPPKTSTDPLKNPREKLGVERLSLGLGSAFRVPGFRAEKLRGFLWRTSKVLETLSRASGEKEGPNAELARFLGPGSQPQLGGLRTTGGLFYTRLCGVVEL